MPSMIDRGDTRGDRMAERKISNRESNRSALASGRFELARKADSSALDQNYRVKTVQLDPCHFWISQVHEKIINGKSILMLICRFWDRLPSSMA